MANQPSPAWWDAQYPDKRRAFDYVSFAVEQVEQLAPLLPDNPSLEGVVRAACIESFWVNVRLLAEFLVRGTDARDWQVQDFAPGWVATDASAAERLRSAWALSSQHVMHLSKTRTPENLTDVEPVSAELYQQVARDCGMVYEDLNEFMDKHREDTENGF
ncbi:hypothetical protein ACGF3G_37535 [Streptomyces sp. NPDC048179]|uniref:hypothetical protein n=1 Tax=Streptomyces sp. NPDC048179 TaxID=3365506 RepID=UPI0037145836